MSLSHLLVAIVLFLLIVNVIFRLKILRKYNKLNNKQINVKPGLLFDRKKMKAYAEKHYPEYAEEIEDFRKSLNALIQLGIWGLLIIVVVFLLIKYVA